jgi:predicted lipid-binding transport protein (Tim44 family)
LGFWRLNWGRIIYFGVLIGAIVVGVMIGGGTGTTITAIAGAVLALTLLAMGGGVGVAARDSVDQSSLITRHPRDREENGHYPQEDD